MSVPGAFMSELVRTVIVMTLSGSALILILLLIRPFVRHHLPRAVQYYMWLLAFAVLLIPISKIIVLPTAANMAAAPFYTLVKQNVLSVTEETNRSAPAADMASVVSAADTSPIVSGQDASAAEAGLFPKAVTGLMLIYPWAVLLMAIYSIVSYAFYTGRLRRFCRKARESDLAVFDELSGGGGHRRPPRLCRSKLAASPMLIGIVRPMILLPDRDYTDAQLRSILLHELIHLRRCDIAVKWLAAVACALHWFNPLVRLARREIDRACEFSCDEAVVRNMDSAGRKDYGQTLIAMTSPSKTPRAILSTTLCEEKKVLKERLTLIMKKRPYGRISLVFSALLLIALLGTAYALGSSGRDPVDLPNHIFVVDEKQEYDKEKLAIYLYSQTLELAKQGRLITMTWYDHGQEKFSCDRLKDYKIHEVHVYELEDDTPDTFRFTVSYSVLPKAKLLGSSGWMAGNGIVEKNGWITRKHAFVEFKKEGNGYRWISEGTGP